jgi:hypothetical protein
MMGENYFLKSSACPTCSHSAEPLHIGKSSIGWKFLLRVYPEFDIYSFIDWNNYITVRIAVDSCVIVNEYDVVIKSVDFLELVHSKQKSKTHVGLQDEYIYSDPSGFDMCRNYFR